MIQKLKLSRMRKYIDAQGHRTYITVMLLEEDNDFNTQAKHIDLRGYKVTQLFIPETYREDINTLGLKEFLKTYNFEQLIEITHVGGTVAAKVIYYKR